MADTSQSAQVVMRLVFDSDDAERRLRRTSAAFTSGIGGIQTALSALIRTVGTLGLGLGVKELIEETASFKAQIFQIEQTFGSLEDSARDAMQRVADASGILETRLHGVGTQIYAFAKTSGMESTQALTMMEDALQVAADSAAYYDRSLEDVSATLQSFLKGNYANDAALGLSATETTRNAAAMALYGKSFQELSEAQKQLTLLQMVKDANRLSGAEGQAAREAEGWENVLGNLKEAWRQLLAVVGQPALHVAIDVVKALTSVLTALTAQAQIAASTLNQIFGWEQSNADAVTAAIVQSTDEQNALTAAVEETAKAQEKLQAASFDEFNIIGGGESDTGAADVTSEITPVINDSQIEPTTKKAVEEAEKVFDRLIGIFDPLKRAWDEYSPDLLASAQKTADSIKGMFSAIGDSIYNVWTNGTGEEIAGMILRTFTNVSDTITNLNTRFTVAWEDDGTGDKIIQNAADHLGILLGAVEDVSKSTSDWASTLDFSPLLESFEGLQKSLTPVLDDIRDGVKWVLDNVLLPFGTWVIEDALPASLDVLSGALDVLTAAIEPLKEPGQWLWDNFIQPLANWTGEIIVTGLEKLADVLHNIGDWIREHPNAALTIGGLTAAFLGLYTVLSGTMISTAIMKIGGFITKLGSLDVTIGVIVAGIVSWVYVITELHENWDDITSAFEESGGVFEFLTGWFEYMGEEGTGVFEKLISGSYQFGQEIYTTIHERIPGFFQDCWNKITEIMQPIGDWFADRWNDIQNVFNSVGTWFGEQFTSAWNGITAVFDGVSGFFENLWTNIKAPFESVATWFHDTFSNAWQRVLDVFSSGGSVFQGIQEGISSIFKDVVNGLIDGINSVLRIPFWNLSEALRVIREWEFAGYYPFEWLPSVEIPELPRLAKGGIVSQPTLAMVGDNPNAQADPEIISPLSKLRAMLPAQGADDAQTLAKLDQLIILLEMLLAAVRDMDTNGQTMSDKDVYAAAQRGKRRVQRMKGMT